MKEWFLSLVLLGQPEQPKEDFNLIPSAKWEAPWGVSLTRDPENLKIWFWDPQQKLWWRLTYPGLKNEPQRKAPT